MILQPNHAVKLFLSGDSQASTRSAPSNAETFTQPKARWSPFDL